jgi:hypothetical protein
MAAAMAGSTGSGEGWVASVELWACVEIVTERTNAHRTVQMDKRCEAMALP